MGGGGWQSNLAIPVPGYEGLKVKPDGKKAWSTTLSCSDEEDFRRAAVTAATATVQAFPGYQVGHQITLFMPGGEQQTFEKISGGGSFQYMPVSTCKKPN